MKKGIIIFSLLLQFHAWAQDTTSIHISEIMFYPQEANGEYIELYNSSDSSIDINNYRIVYSTSSADTIVSFAHSTILPPKHFAAVFENDYDFSSGEYMKLITDTTLVLQIDNSKFGSSGMSNTSDRFVYLLDNNNDTIDVHMYITDNVRGYSDEKINLEAKNDSTNWSNSKVINGTPGKRNSVSPYIFDLSIISISFEPQNNFVESQILISTKIKNLGLNEAHNFTTKIYNDLTHDSLSQPNEIFLNKTISSLSVGDSIEVGAELVIDTTGNYSICAEINFEQDENKQNNFYSTPLIVYPKPNVFNDIVINEMMFKPLEDQPEWIELYNKTEQDVNLSNWRIADKSTQPLISDTIIIIKSHDYMILTESADIANYFELGSEWVTLNLPSLNNTGDNIKLLDSLGRIIDSVNYSQSWGGANGYSLERISPNIESNNSLNWNSSNSKYFGTPGKINSITQKRNDLEISFVKTPFPYAVMGEYFQILFQVKNIGINIQSDFEVEIFYDSNHNLETENDELLKSTSYGNLFSGDSVVVTENLSEFIEGRNNYFIKVRADSDDYYENNEIQIEFNAIKINEIRNDLVINEIMHSPKSPEPEWVEIFNRSNKEINLDNYQIADKSDTSTVIFNSLFIKPNEYLVFSGDSTILNLYSDKINFIKTKFPNLNNAGDKIILLDSLNRVIDSLEFTDNWGGNSGKSLERINSEFASTDSTNWSSCKLSLGGTPGTINSNSQKDFDIVVSDILFNPTTPNHHETVSISANILNIGKENAVFQLQLLEDIFLDSSDIRLVETSIPNNLTAGDSITVTFLYTIENINKKHSFIVKAIMNEDQDTTNNHLTKSISPSFLNLSVVVNEVMYSPLNGEPEWIELFNTTDDSISISDFSITDILTTPKSAKIETNKIIAPNNYFIISKDSSIVDYHTSIPSETLIINFSNLNNDVDGIVLKDSFGKTIDSVMYKSNWGGTNGYSLERVLAQNSSTDSSNWYSSHDIELSTPGRKNSVTPFEFDLNIAEINTIPYHPTKNDYVYVEVIIKNLGLNTIQDASIKIEFNDGNGRQLLDKITNLNITDSLIIQSSNSVVIPDSLKIFVSLYCSSDQNTTNNFADTLIFPRTGRNTILINEFMANPQSGEAEWIEIYNNSDNPIDISKWFISDLYSTPKLVIISDTSTILEPNSFFVISNDTANFNFDCSNLIQAKFGTLGNTEDGIILYDFTKEIVDSLKYNSDWDIEKGRSLERESFEIASCNISNWLPSLAKNGGTPGSSNSILKTSPSSKNSIVVNEIMYDPDKSNSEFIELYNTTNEPIDIGGWQLVIDDKDFFEINPSFFNLKANEYFVVASDSIILNRYSFSSTNIVHMLTSGSLSLSNTGESIVLLDHWNNVIDSVNYNENWHNKNIATTKDKSIERISPQINSNEPTNWSTSVSAAGATPGKGNSIFTKNDNRTSGISFNPNPFSPDNDGFEDFSIINFSLPFNTAQIRIKIFDDHGRLVRNLINNKSVANNGSILFNGLDEAGTPLRIGMYIVFLEAVDLNSGKLISFKDVIVVARKL